MTQLLRDSACRPICSTPDTQGSGFGGMMASGVWPPPPENLRNIRLHCNVWSTEDIGGHDTEVYDKFPWQITVADEGHDR